MEKLKKIFEDGYFRYYVFNFGKHKGKRVEEVIIEDPNYVRWCASNVDGFKLQPKWKSMLDSSLWKEGPEGLWKLRMHYII